MTLRAAWLASLLTALAPVAAGAQERGAFELVLIDPLPAGAHARIAGQTADLSWQLTRAAAAPGASMLEQASEAAEQREARAALWIEESDDAFELRLLDARRRRLLERRFEIERGAGGLARSAALEALALAVRSALRALEADQEVGEAVRDRESGVGAENRQQATGNGQQATGTGTGAGTGSGTGEAGRAREQAREAEREREARERERKRKREEAEAREDADEDADERADEQAEAEEEAREAEEEAREEALDGGEQFDEDAVGLVVAAGWDLAVDGRSPHGQHAPWVRAGVAFGRVEIGVRAEAALPAVLENDEAEVELARRLLLGYVGVDLMRAAPLRLAAALAVGAASFRRETDSDSVAPGFEGTDPEDTLAFAAGLEVRAAYTLAEGAGARFSIELAAGALLVPAAPVLRFDTASQPRDEALWWLQPELRLGPHLRVRL